MGAKTKSRLIALVMAVALMMTSGVAVFANSPTGGATTTTTTAATSVDVTGSKTITVSNAAGATTVKYRLKGTKKWKTAAVVNGTAVLKKLKKHKTYEIKVNGVTYYKLTCGSKVKSAKVSGKTVKVKAKKVKCAKKYVIKAVRASDGKVVTKTVKSPSAKLKLDSGTWTVTVTIKKGKYVGRVSAAKTVTIP